MPTLDLEIWKLVLTLVSTSVVVVGVPIALLNLRKISKTHHLQALTKFHEDLASCEAERYFLFAEYDRSSLLEEIDRDTEIKLEAVINMLNRIGLLVEQKILSAELVFSICHTVIIRSWFQLELYANSRELRDGSRYGRRIKRLDKRAKRFHDIRPHQRKTEIYLVNPSGRTLIYSTTCPKSILGWPKRFYWKIRYLLKIY